jgi:hypothetical protein
MNSYYKSMFPTSPMYLPVELSAIFHRYCIWQGDHHIAWIVSADKPEREIAAHDL